MYFVRRRLDFRIISSAVRCYSFAKKSHYEILKLRRNCTDKEIKDAFITLSKEYHPDKNKSARAQEQFVQILEAYSILGKPSKRAKYDSMNSMDMRQHSSYAHRPTATAYNYTWNPNVRNHNYNQRTSTREESSEKGHTATASGVRKIPNYVLILLCFGIAFFGTILQVVVIRELYVVHRKQNLEKSRHLAEELEKVRTAAMDNGNDMQTRLLLERIVTGANPVVATASLGQALANEKK